MVFKLSLVCLVLLLAAPRPAVADPTPFDLAGPKLDVRVTNAGRTLPIAQTPNLAAGEQLWIKADFPPDQSAHYLLVAAFLRGATNPPPKTWFYASQTWSPKGRDGLKIIVPPGAQQVLLFLAPETGGDFKTLIDAVRGRPGAFVRAAQGLNQATLDRSRLDTFLAAIRGINRVDPGRLKTASPLLARSLAIKLDAACLDKAPELQGSCLMQGQDSLVLDDGHSTSIVQALTSGSPAGLVQQLASTPQAGFGYYSPYIASVMDIARILDSFHTAQYQYLPALVTEQGEVLSLLLNAPPSFYNPKSVLVVALPAIEPTQAPPLHPVDPDAAYCAEQPDLVLPVEGAPLVFSTSYAHDMVLRLKAKTGETVDVPVTADAEKGGFVVDAAGLGPTEFADSVDGNLHGEWGFAPYDGPKFHLQNAGPQSWRLAADDQQALIVGRDGAVHLEAQESGCVESVLLRRSSGQTEPVGWTSIPPNRVRVTLPLEKASPGTLTLLIKPYGAKNADLVPLQAFDQPSHLDSFTLHAGDLSGVLKGGRLDAVKELSLGGVVFTPGSIAATGGGETLSLTTADAPGAAALKAGDAASAKVTLKDGRVLDLETAVEPPRPRVSLIDKSIQLSASNASSWIRLDDPDALPRGARLTFSIHAQVPAAFSGDEKMEVGTAQGAFLTTLTVANGLMFEDAQVALASLDTDKAFSVSAAGPLRFRIVDDGVAGDWQPLATLVRLPVFRDLKCPTRHDQACKLTGSDLFLLASVSNDPAFDHPVQVPDGFAGDVLAVPHPVAGRLYLKLRDDPAVVRTVSIPVKGAASAKAGQGAGPAS